MSIYEQALAAQAIRLHDDDLAGLFDTLVSEPIADLSIVPDVGVALVSRKWQHSAMDDALTNPDAEAIRLLSRAPPTSSPCSSTRRARAYGRLRCRRTVASSRRRPDDQGRTGEACGHPGECGLLCLRVPG